MNPKDLSDLTKILGEGNVKSGRGALSPYFREAVADLDLALVTPETVEQLSDVAAFSDRRGLPLFTVKRKYCDDMALEGKKGLLVDLCKLKAIKKIDKTNLTANVYAGVTFEQLQNELDHMGLRLLFPVAGTSPSVVRSYIDRDILMGSGGYRHPHISVFHAMLADGQIWVSGSQQLTDEGHADFREDQGPQFSQFFGASEDIYGIPYYGLVYLYPDREFRKVAAFGFDELEPAKDLVYRVSRAEWCFEAFAANDRYLSVLLAQGDADRVAAIKKKLNPWTVVFSMEHYRELVELWDRYIRQEAKARGGKALKGQVPDSIEELLRKPWYVYDRDFFRGRTDHVFCYQHFSNIPSTFETVDRALEGAGYKDEAGKIVVPTYFGGAAYCEADLYYDPSDPEAARAGREGYLKAFEALLDEKAFVDKPTGHVARMVFDRTDPSYPKLLKTFKRTVDPKGLLNPDQLLEGV